MEEEDFDDREKCSKLELLSRRENK